MQKKTNKKNRFCDLLRIRFHFIFTSTPTELRVTIFMGYQVKKNHFERSDKTNMIIDQYDLLHCEIVLARSMKTRKSSTRAPP